MTKKIKVVDVTPEETVAEVEQPPSVEEPIEEETVEEEDHRHLHHLHQKRRFQKQNLFLLNLKQNQK